MMNGVKKKGRSLREEGEGSTCLACRRGDWGSDQSWNVVRKEARAFSKAG